MFLNGVLLYFGRPQNYLNSHLVEKLENERNAVGEDEMLTHELKLINMIDFEML